LRLELCKKSKLKKMLHEETVSEGTLALIRRMTQDEMLKDFTLVGGTALALQLGHRKSVDIDLFGSRDFDGGRSRGIWNQSIMHKSLER
jgi:hypothetical protein